MIRLKSLNAAGLAALIVLGAFFALRKQATAPGNGLPLASSGMESVEPAPIREPNIIVTSPKPGDRVTNPILVSGRARVFENTFNYRLLNDQGMVLFENFATAQAPDVGEFGNFEVKIPILTSTSVGLIIEVFEYSAKDGSVVNLVRVPVTLASDKITQFKIFLPNQELQRQTDPDLIACDRVFPVERETAHTREPALLALYYLAAGQNTGDNAGETKKEEHRSALPLSAGNKHPLPLVQINSVIIKNGIAYADFNQALQQNVAGSCRVTAIRAQIEATLKQFPSVKSVVLSIDGRTDNILQP